MTSHDELYINTIRTLAMDAIEKAKSGHPGMVMGAASIAYVLWTRHLRFNPQNPDWFGRDRFILSAGHASMLLYGLLHLSGFDVSLDDIKNFRQLGSKTPGHPEHGLTPGVEVSTGPLGQGFGNAVGIAIAQAHLAARFNRPKFPIADFRIYGICSDGDIMEGVSSEAASLAGHFKLGNLIFLYDDNGITIEGSTSLTFSEDVGRRFEALGWHVQKVDGHDVDAIHAALQNAEEEKSKPSLIIAKTYIAFGSPNKQDTAAAHGAPLGEEEVALTKRNLGWPHKQPFTVPEEAYAPFREAAKQGEEAEGKWRELFTRYKKEHPGLAGEWNAFKKGELPENWRTLLPKFSSSEKPIATRTASGKVLNALKQEVPALIGGSADLGTSVMTYLEGCGDFSADNYAARNLHFGIREHAMATILSGMALAAPFQVFGSTFLVFSDYMRPAIRLAAMMRLKVVYVFSHDSIGVGEDGPSHQPVEQLAALRALPNLLVFRPADAKETVASWEFILEYKTGPVALILSRQALPILDIDQVAVNSGVRRGGYVVYEAKKGAPKLLLIATGSEVHLIIAAAMQLEKEGIRARAVSLPSWEIFMQQPRNYRDEILPPSISARLAVEAATPLGWERFIGLKGTVLGMESFGTSAPGGQLFEHFGFTVQNIVDTARSLLR
ncbi:MAG: transketolase [bacterium]